MRAVRSAGVSRYRRTGADLPWGDPRRYHGVPLEGHCWRFTDAAAGRVVLALCGVNRDRTGRSWGFVGLAAHPGGFFRSAIVADAAADRRRLGVRAGTAFSADAEHVRLDLGPDCRLEAALGATGRWPRAAFGALGGAHAVPGLSQYWHPHVLGGTASGTVTAGGAGFSLAGARVYAEKNWGAGFPRRWWWGEAHDFGADPVCVAFAGGRVGIGRAEVPATALVVRLNGHVLALGLAQGAPVRARVGEEAWRVRGRSLHHRVELEGTGVPGAAHALTVPMPEERRALPGSHHHLAAAVRLRVWRGRRLLFAGESPLAGLERGAT